jgi:tetratricopeptide (TPR) repeat protein
MVGSHFFYRRACATWFCVLLVGFSSVALAVTRKPKRREDAPEIRAQILQQELTDSTLSGDQRAKLLIELARNDYLLKNFNDEAQVLEDALAAGVTNAAMAADAYYYLGRTYQALGDGEQAGSQFDTVWQQYPDSRYHLHAAMELGDLALMASNSEAATEWYQTIIEQQPMSRLAFLARDKLRAMTNGVSAAQISDESRRPVYLKEQFRRLDQYLYSQLYDKANALAQQLTDSATNAQERAALNYHLAHHYWMYGNVEGAGNCVTNALQTTGERHVHALILAGHITRALGQTDTALGFYQQAISAAPSKEMAITAYQQSTRLLYKSGHQAAALAMAAAGKRAFTGKPELAAYLDRISNTLHDRAEPAWTNYAAQVVMTATNELGRRALQQLSKEASRRGDWSQAERYSRQLAARSSKSWRDNVNAQIRLLDVQLRGTNLVAAGITETNLIGSVSTLPSDEAKAYALFRLGKIWRANGNSARAETLWQQILASYPANYWEGMTQIQLAELYGSRGDLTSAVAMYETFLQHAPPSSRYRLYATAWLVRLKQTMGDPVGAGSLLENAKALALQTHDAELQLHLARYFFHYSDKAVARQLLEAGIQNADTIIQTEKDPQKRLWWEYLIARRLDDFQQFARLGDRALRIEPGLLQNPMVSAYMRIAMYTFLTRALEESGRWADAELLCQQLIQIVPEDSASLGHVLYRLTREAENRGDPSRMRQFALDAFREVPTSFVSQRMYFHLAVDDFNAGQYANALAKIADLERAVPLTRHGPKYWSDSFHWDCDYVKGRCLKAMGNTSDGQRLVAGAIAKKGFVAQLYDLREPGTTTP